VSAQEQDGVERAEGSAETVAGFLAVAALTIGAIGIVYRPIRLAVPAIVLALVASGMARGRFTRLAGIAVIGATVCWVAGMIVAVLTENPLW
jgi:hypothetical protein